MSPENLSDNESLPENKYVYVPAEGHGLAHNPFNAIVGPRPIGWISSMDAEGAINLAPYSFFNGFNYYPPIVGFSSTDWKDSVANAEATGEFVWNLVTRDLAERMNATSAPAPHGVNEFELAGLTMAPSLQVKPPRVGESPVNFECRVTQIVRLKDVGGHEVDAWMTFGEVVAAHVDRSLIKDGIFDTAAARPVLRAGGPTGYVEVTPEAFFHMTRPR